MLIFCWTTKDERRAQFFTPAADFLNTMAQVRQIVLLGTGSSSGVPFVRCLIAGGCKVPWRTAISDSTRNSHCQMLHTHVHTLFVCPARDPFLPCSRVWSEHRRSARWPEPTLPPKIVATTPPVSSRLVRHTLCFICRPVYVTRTVLVACGHNHAIDDQTLRSRCSPAAARRRDPTCGTQFWEGLTPMCARHARS